MNCKDIQTQLKKINVHSLDPKEQELVWEHIRLHLVRSQKPVEKKGYSKISTLRKSIAVTLIFGMTAGTAFAANDAKPGDLLFPLDRAIESIQMSVTPENKKDELKIKFALERVGEVKSILKEVAASQTKTTIKTAPEEPTPLVIEETPVIEVQPVEESSQTIEENVPTEDMPIETSPVEETTEAVLSEGEQQTDDVLETDDTDDTDLQEGTDNAEDDSTQQEKEVGSETVGTPETQATEEMSQEEEYTDETTPEENQGQTEEPDGDNVSLSEGDKKRIELALGTALSFLGDVKGELAEQGNEGAVEYIDLMLEQINKEIDTLPENVTFEVDLSTKKEFVKFEIISRDDKPKVQIEVTEPKENVPEDQEVPEEETICSEETTLEIKNGGLVITPTKDSLDTDSDENEAEGSDLTEEADEKTIKDEEQTEGTLPEDSATEAEEDKKDIADIEETVEEVVGSEEESSTAANDPTQTEGKENDEDDGTTTVKVIIKKLDEDFEFSVTDQNEGLHDIIEEYTEGKEDV